MGFPRIFVANLDRSVDESALYQLFARFVEVNAATVARNRGDGQSRGFGFVELSNEADVASALELDGYLFRGRCLSVARAKVEGGKKLLITGS